MLKIHQMFMTKFLLIFAVTLIVASIISYITLKSVILQQHQKNLQNSISLIQLQNIDNLQEYTKKITQATEFKMTIISENGDILAGSNILNTKKDSFVYATKKTKYKNGLVYVKFFMEVDVVMSEFYSLYLKLLLLFLFIFIIAFYNLKKMSKKVTFDITQVINYLDEISCKNYTAIIKVKYFYEFLQISITLKNLAKRLHSRDKKKIKK